MKTTLIIVESPAKCKKIEEYLGPGYKCMASYGHLRNLTNMSSIDIKDNFNVSYSLTDEPLKLKQIEKLRTAIASSNDIIIATDDDREGEGIAWHICILFNLPVENTKRIIFHEITENALQKSILNPLFIDMNKVKAQQSRQILDILVGFTISPLLWKHISVKTEHSLSAGRCQTPALKLIYDNYLDIKNSPGVLVYNITGYFTNLNLQFELNKQLKNKEEVKLFLEEILNKELLCNVSTPLKVIKKAPEPLTTSSLQQLASNELNLSPKETMKHAQTLYENGLITYMRTDSKQYSGDFIEKTKKYIEENYIPKLNEPSYINQNIDKLKVGEINKELKNKKKTSIIIQEAHEAIRPVLISNKVNNLELDGKVKKLYELIWKRTLESCMSSAQYHSITATINVNECVKFIYKTEQIIFAGWQIIDSKTNNNNDIYNYLLSIKKGINVLYKKIEAKMILNELTLHLTESHLIKLLEDKGIGRPSTYAMLVEKIQERDYVKKENIIGKELDCIDYVMTNKIIEKINKREYGNEKGKLVIQPLGIIVIEYLIEKCHNIFDYEYTKNMEEELDLISKGKKDMLSLCNSAYNELTKVIENVKDDKKYSIKIDETHELIIGKYGPVVKHTEGNITNFIKVRKDINIDNLKLNNNIKLEEIIDSDIEITKMLIGKYEGEDLYVKKGKYGIYAQWGTKKQGLCDYGNVKLEYITYIDVLKLLEKDNLLNKDKPIGFIREITPYLTIRNGKFGDYIMYKKKGVKTPVFLSLKEFKGDYKKCDNMLIINWINQTYKLEISLK